MGQSLNVQALNDLLEEYGINKNGALTEFYAVVVYQPKNIVDTTKIQVQTDTFNYGNIEIIPTDSIDLNVVHTGFKIDYNIYQYDAGNKELIISGKAHISKGGKPYKITIKPC